MPKLFKYFLIAVSLFGCGAAVAAPKLCSPGYQDSTCVTPIARAPIAAPQCSTGPGWTTTATPVWQGAYWSSPGCSYQPPPACPSGFTQTSGPTWNGGAWVGLVCAPQATTPPGPTCASNYASPPVTYLGVTQSSCHAGNGCDYYTVSVFWNSPGTPTWSTTMQPWNQEGTDRATFESMIDSAIAGSGYSRGPMAVPQPIIFGGGIWAVCR